MRQDVVVVTGLGGMGQAIARRLGSGRQLLLADIDSARLAETAAALEIEGFRAQTVRLNVADPASVAALADQARELGGLSVLVHTVGISPSMASSERVLAVDLVGTARVIDAFLPLAAPGTVAVVIASMAPSFFEFDRELERQLALAPIDELLAHGLRHPQIANGHFAYALAKRGNQLRVEAAASAWGARGARIVSVSPGVISTAQGLLELKTPEVAELIRRSPMGRVGTSYDIAGVVSWLVSPEASFVTGTDIRIDSGSVAKLRWG